MEFSERIRKLRTESGETQAETSAAIGITTRQYQGLEAGKSVPSYKSFLALADHFGVSLDYLAGRTDQR